NVARLIFWTVATESRHGDRAKQRQGLEWRNGWNDHRLFDHNGLITRIANAFKTMDAVSQPAPHNVARAVLPLRAAKVMTKESLGCRCNGLRPGGERRIEGVDLFVKRSLRGKDLR